MYELLTPADGNTGFDERWQQRVLEDHIWMQEYGAPFDLRELPEPEFQAHLAIIQGENMREADEHEKQQREANKQT